MPSGGAVRAAQIARRKGSVAEEEAGGIRLQNRHGSTRESFLDRKLLALRLELESRMQGMLLHAAVFIFCFLCVSICVMQYQPIAAMHTIHSNLETYFSWDQARSARSMADVYAYFDAFISATYGMSNAIIDATTFDSLPPKGCLAGDDRCFSPPWRMFSDSNFSNMTSAEAIANSPHTLVFNKRIVTEFAAPQVLFSEAAFTASTISVLTPLVFQEMGSWAECSLLGKFYNDEINKTKFKYQYSNQALALLFFVWKT